MAKTCPPAPSFADVSVLKVRVYTIVTPAESGVQVSWRLRDPMDSGLRRNDRPIETQHIFLIFFPLELRGHHCMCIRTIRRQVRSDAPSTPGVSNQGHHKVPGLVACISQRHPRHRVPSRLELKSVIARLDEGGPWQSGAGFLCAALPGLLRLVANDHVKKTR